MGWIRRAIERKFLGDMGKEAEHYIGLMANMDGDEVAFVLVTATDLRSQMYKNGHDLLLPSVCIAKDILITTEMARLVREYQKNKMLFLASGMMVWVHTLRAIQWLPLRPHGRRLWKELTRGMPYIDQGMETFVDAFGVMPVVDGIERVPEGLSPEPT